MRYYFRCPSCVRDEGFTIPSEESSGLGCLLLLFGGFIPALLYANAQSRRVQCDHCGYIFRQPALPKTGVAKLATAILLVNIFAILFAIVLFSFPEIAGSIPKPTLVQDNILMTTDQVVAFVLLVAATTLTVLSLCFFASVISSIAQKRRLSKEFELHPKQKGPNRNDRKRKATDDGKESSGTNSSKSANDRTGDAQE